MSHVTRMPSTRPADGRTGPPRVLTIAGTDPSGGAGIQADLKSIAANGGYGMAVVTALVAQNTVGVRSIHLPPVAFLSEQLDAVSDDVTIDAVKIGMLFDAPVVTVVRDWLRRVRPPVVVLDPVMVATSGDRLLVEDAAPAITELLDGVDLVMPNVAELAALLDERPARTWDEMLDQARRLSQAHRVHVLATGGHLDGPTARDALVDGGTGTVTPFAAPRIDTPHTHGTGCSLSAAVATRRAARDGTWASAVDSAKEWLTESIEAGADLHVGTGTGPVSHFAGLWQRGGTTTRPRPARLAEDWWTGIADIRQAIDDLEFVRGLADGSLDADAFVWYLAQDALYLRDYARALAQTSALAPTPAEQSFWASSAHGAIAAELALHGRWLDEEAMFAATPGPATTAYVDHLLATAARGSYPELVAALLPCFWVYSDLGGRLVRHAAPGHPYQAWLTTYGDPVFDELTTQAVAIVTTHAAAADGPVRRRMRRAFEVSARHELAFFAAPPGDARGAAQAREVVSSDRTESARATTPAASA